MTLASQIAARTAAEHGRDPWQIAAQLRVPVYEESLPAGLTELYVADPANDGMHAVILDRRLPPTLAREMLAHALAHHLLHVGNRLSREAAAVWSGRHEREADDFAAFLLIPDEPLRARLQTFDQPSVEDMADEFDVSMGLMRRRLVLAKKSLDTVS